MLDIRNASDLYSASSKAGASESGRPGCRAAGASMAPLLLPLGARGDAGGQEGVVAPHGGGADLVGCGALLLCRRRKKSRGSTRGVKKCSSERCGAHAAAARDGRSRAKLAPWGPGPAPGRPAALQTLNKQGGGSQNPPQGRPNLLHSSAPPPPHVPSRPAGAAWSASPPSTAAPAWPTLEPGCTGAVTWPGLQGQIPSSQRQQLSTGKARCARHTTGAAPCLASHTVSRHTGGPPRPVGAPLTSWCTCCVAHVLLRPCRRRPAAQK